MFYVFIVRSQRSAIKCY